MRSKIIIVLFLLLAPVMTLTNSVGDAEAQQENQQLSLEEEFDRASQEYGVPADLLKAMGYVNTRWEMPPPDASDYEEAEPREGEPEARGNYGMMSLYKNPDRNTLGRAAELTGLPEEKLKTDRAANIRGGAALLADIQGEEKPDNINGWYDAIAEGWNGNLYANQVYEILQSGASEEVSGEMVVLEANPDAEQKTTFSAQAAADYGGATWYGNNGSNYTNASRGAANIDKIVIHVAQGSWAGTLDWFRNPSNPGSSAHYTVSSRYGKIGQSVREEDIAWHAGWWDYNKRSIGIEHEGYVSNPDWFTENMYRSSARLTAHLAKKYNIAINRENIIGHHEVPGCSGSGGGAGCHTDPGTNWDWAKYIRLVKSYAGNSTSKPAYKQVVDNASSRFRASRAWEVNTWNSRKYGKNYRAVKPGRRGTAKFKLKVPKKAGYVVEAWWPAASKYNNRTKFKVRTAGGWKQKTVNQRKNGGKWVRLGKFTMRAGDRVYVKVPRRTSGSGYIVADAVKMIKP